MSLFFAKLRRKVNVFYNLQDTAILNASIGITAIVIGKI